MKRTIICLIAVCLLFVSTFAMAEGATGVFEGTGTGRMGAINVAVTLDNGVITAIEVGDHTETVGVCELPIEQIPAAIVENQSLLVDTVSGATGTSNGIIEAVSAALTAAGADLDAYKIELTKEESAIDIGEPDMIVCGGGLAGMVAAIRGAELGGKVVLFEQSSRLGGSALYAGGWIHGAGTKMQEEAGITGDNGAAMVEDFIRINGEGTFDTELALVHANKSGEAVDWLKDYVGVEFDGTVSFGAPNYPQMSTPRIYMGAQGGASYTNALIAKIAAFEAAGDIIVVYNTPVTEVVLDDNGAAKGVIAGGYAYDAPAVILATGGYGHNEEWLKKYNFDHVTTSAFVTASGTGYDIIEKLGGKFTAMEYCGSYAGSVPFNGFDNLYNFDVYGLYPSVIWVDNTGKRIANEMDQTAASLPQHWVNAPGNEVYIIYDEEMKLPDRPMLSALLGVVPTAEESAALMDKLEAEGNCVFKADTIEELANKIGMDPAALTETVEKYNGYCEAGLDEDFGRTTYLDKLDKGPFYAVYTVPFVLLTSGGPATDPYGRLKGADGEVIPGIFVCGELLGTGNLSGELTIGGIALGSCTTMGMISAECALEYVNEMSANK